MNRQRRLLIIILLGMAIFPIYAQGIVANESLYAMFGDSTETLDRTSQIQQEELCIPVLFKDSTQATIVFDFYQMIGKLIDKEGKVIAVDTLNKTQRGRFISIDPNAENYYHVSPYAYCMNNPINAIDPDGRYRRE